MKKKLIALAVSLAFAILLCPSLALADGAGNLTVASTELTTQSIDFRNAHVKFTDNVHRGESDSTWQLYFMSGAKKPAEPQFDVYLNGKKIPKSAYTVKYYMHYFVDDKEIDKPWKADNLIASASPNANVDDMSTSYRYVITPKADSGYTGEFSSEQAEVVVADKYSFGRYMAVYLAKAAKSWRYGINPMNRSYYVIPQTKVKETLNSIACYAGSTADEGGMKPDGEKVNPKYYSITYYKAVPNAVKRNLSPVSSAKTGGALRSMPSDPGSYVAIISGKKPYYGQSSFYFDIQGKLSSTKISGISKKTENGKHIEPGVKVTYKGKTLKEGIDYVVTYQNNLKAGTATAIVTGSKVISNTNGMAEDVDKARYFTGKKVIKFKIEKNAKKTWKNNPMKVAVKNIKVSASKLKGKRYLTLPAKNVFSVSNNKGSMVYKQLSGPYVLEVAKNGNVKVGGILAMFREHSDKDLKYSVKVEARAKGNKEYYAKKKAVVVTVTITK